MRSSGQPELVYVLLRDGEAEELISVLRKSKNHTAETLRKELKKVLR
jgi:hypothetical protein